MAQEEKDCRAGSMILSFFLGGLVGAGIALLVAPASGEETRKKVKELAEDAKKKAEAYIEEAKSKAASVVEEAKSKAALTMEKGKELL